MSIFNTINCWLNVFLHKNCPGDPPAFLPLTKEEIHEVKHNAILYANAKGDFNPGAPTKVYGLPVHETAFAVEQRARQLTVPFLHLEETCSHSCEYTFYECLDKMRLHLTQRVCAETASLQVKFEWDCWAGFKRELRITRWFPIKTRLALIDGRVLYPYLKVGLPHNRHSVQFKIAGIS